MDYYIFGTIIILILVINQIYLITILVNIAIDGAYIYRFIARHHHHQMFLNDITNYKIASKLVPLVSVAIFWL
jgi:hypothetical protein